MRKYIIKNADGSAQSVMPAIHNTRKEALLTILRYTTKSVEDSDDDCPTEGPIKYIIHPVEEVEVNERIKNFHDAREALGRKPNPIRVIPSHVSSKIDLSFDSVVSLVGELNPKHLESLVALNQLFTIAEAWNEEDNFVPDFSDYNQAKWFPCFEYNKGTAKFVFDRARYTLLCANAPTQPRLCFMTPERAKQFGEQFIDIYNKVLCNKYGR